MTMERRLGFQLDRAQIEKACVEFVTPRLLPDEQAKAKLILNVEDKNLIACVINVEKKRARKKNGASA